MMHLGHGSIHAKTFALVIGLAVVGCSTGGQKAGAGPVDIEEPFPEQEQLEEIDEGERPTSFFGDRRTHVETWEMEGPLSEEIGPQPMAPETPWERILDEEVESASDDTVASRGMNCLARQLGEFFLENDAFPSGDLRVFLRSRCGVVAAGYSKVWWTWEEPPERPVEELAEQWKSDGIESLRKLVEIDHASVGIWYGEDEDGAVLVAPAGERSLELEAAPVQVAADETVVLEGETHRNFRRIRAVHTRGRFGYGDCEVDHSVEAPKFQIRCPIDPEAPYTHVDVTIFPTDRSLGRIVLSNAFWREGAEDRMYRPTATSRAVARGFREVFGGSKQGTSDSSRTEDAGADESLADDGSAGSEAKSDPDAANGESETSESSKKADAESAESTESRESGNRAEGESAGSGEVESASVERDSESSEQSVEGSEATGREEAGASGDSSERAEKSDAEEGEESEREAPSLDEAKFVELVNAVRSHADREPLSFEKAESQTARRLAGRYFRARFGNSDPRLTEEIALGLLAGWKVRAPVISASFSSRAVQSDRPEVLLERMLATPSGRTVLLGEEFGRLAVGLAQTEEAGALGALVTAYRQLPDETPQKRAERALEAINSARADFDAAPIQADTSLETKIAELARKIESNQLSLRKAQRQLLSVASQLWKTRVRSVGMISRSLDRVNLDERLETAPIERAAVLVAPYRPEDAAWTSYVIFVVHPAPSDTTAQAPDFRRPSPRERRSAELLSER